MRRLAALLWVLVGMSCLRVPDELSSDPDSMPVAPSTAGEVLDRHVKGLGGEELLRGLTSRTVEARMVFHPMEGCTAEDEGCITEQQVGSFVLRSTAKGQLYRRTVLGDLIEERGYDGKTGWQVRGDRVVQIEDAKESLLSREDALLHWYFDLPKRGVQVTLIPARDKDEDGKSMTLDGLRWEVPGTDSPPKELWFDRRTGLLHEERVEDGAEDERRSQTISYDDYRAVDGALIPHKIVVRNEAGERAQQVEFLTQRVDHKPIEPKLFVIPKPEKPDKVPDNALAQLAVAKSEAAAAPKDAASQVRYARAAFAAAHFDEAAQAAKATLALDPKEPEALLTQARVHVLGGRYSAAQRVLSKARKAGIRPDAVARQQAWIYARTRDFRKLAKALDKAGNPVLAGRFRSFTGKPLIGSVAGGACVAKAKLTQRAPLAITEIEIGGEKVQVIVDTGASDLILANDYAKKIGVTIRSTTQLQKDGPTVGHGQLDSVKIGEATIKNVPADVFDRQAIDEMAGERGKVSGVLGVRALSGFQVTVDLPGGTFELVPRTKKCAGERAARRSGDAVPFWLHETHYMYVLAEMNGAEGLYLINTGMRGASLTATQKAFSHAGIGAPALRRDEAPMVKVQEFALGDAIRNRGLAAAFGFFEQNVSTDGFRIDGMAGLDVFRGQRWTIDFDEHAFYFQAKAPKGK